MCRMKWYLKWIGPVLNKGVWACFTLERDYLPESSGYHLVVPKKWFIATKWGTVYTCTIRMLYFSMGFQEKLFFSSEETIIFWLRALSQQLRGCQKIIFLKLHFCPTKRRFFPTLIKWTHCHTGQTTTYFLQKKWWTTKILVFSNSRDFARHTKLFRTNLQEQMEHHGTTSKRTTIWNRDIEFLKKFQSWIRNN